MSLKPHHEPIQAAAERGEVVLDGPSGLAVSLTPDAAIRSADAMLRAARVARDDPAAESR